MAEWEEILRRRAQVDEERKREYLRWTATGVTAIAVLVGVVLQSIGTVRLGPHFYVSLSILFVGSYLTTELVWELARENIIQAVGRLAGTPRAARPWDLVPTPADFANVPISKIAWDLRGSLAITVVVALDSWVIVTPASGPFFQLAVFRIATLGFWGLTFSVYRSLKRTLPTAGASRVGGFFFGKALVLGYYGFQLWLATAAFNAVSIVALQGPPLILIVLEGVGILSIGRVIWRIAWPLVNSNATAMAAFTRIQDRMLSGEYSTPNAIAVEVKRIYSPEKEHD